VQGNLSQNPSVMLEPLQRAAEPVLRANALDSVYHTLIESMDEAFCVIEMLYDSNGTPNDWLFVEANPAFEKNTGLEQPVGKTIRQMIPDIETHWFEKYGNVARTGESVRFEDTVVVMHRHYDVFAYRIVEGEAKKVGILFKDITQKKELLSKLREQADSLARSHAQLLSFITNAPVSIVILDKDMNYLATSSRWRLNYGLGLPDVVGRNHYEMFPDLPAKWKVFHQQGLAGATSINNEEIWARADGQHHWLRWSLQPWFDENGSIGGIIIADEDISDRKQSERALQEMNVELMRVKDIADKANLAKTDFLAGMSHELRTPLNAILGFTQLLATGAPAPTATQMERLDQILQAGWHLLNLINEVLDLAMIESGKSAMSMEPVSLSGILFECQSMFEPQAREANIHLHFRPVDSTWFVDADRTKLKQVITNLLSNAIKYNKEHGTVEVKCSEDTPGRLRISVKDCGAGLSQKKLAQLFQPFNRLGQENGLKEGSGIGLAVSKKLIEMMGGSIGVESTVSVGSDFWIELERHVSSPPTEVIKSSDELLSQPARDASGHTVLYVEDSPANLMLVKHILNDRLHMRLLSASDGIQGVARAREQIPDIILMDINLPGISGLDAMFLLRNDTTTKHIPVIALSANAMQMDIDEALQAGFFRYLTKPIKINELTEALCAAMNSAGNLQVPA
jgi:PAS domain S-box-containing protein